MRVRQGGGLNQSKVYCIDLFLICTVVNKKMPEWNLRHFFNIISCIYYNFIVIPTPPEVPAVLPPPISTYTPHLSFQNQRPPA